MCQQGNSEVVNLPDHIHPDKENRTVSLDRCIADTIKALWAADVQTLGCCCGHGKADPDVVIAQGADEEEITRIADLLRADGRPWKILQWRLNEVATVDWGSNRLDAMIL